jgi:ankyrin repeat protein
MNQRKSIILVLLVISELLAVPGINPSENLVRQQKMLHKAIKTKDTELAQTLLANGADANAKYYGRIPLHDAVYDGNEEIIKLLLNNGANINKQDEHGRTALHMYVGFIGKHRPKKKHIDIVRLLLAHGASFETKDIWGNSPIETAMSCHRPDIVEALLSGTKNMTIHQAAYIGQWERIEFLLDNGIEINAQDEKGRTPLCLAACMGNQLDIVEQLIAGGADVTLGSKTWTPLYGAIYYSHYDIAKILIDNGADVNIQKHEGMTPLHVAIEFSYQVDPMYIIEHLLTHGARLDIEDESGATPVDTAIARNRQLHDRSDVVALLLRKIPNKTIHQAAYAGQWERIDSLLKSGTYVDKRDREGCTALYYAAWGNKLQVAGRLINKGADVNAKNKKGLALLHDLAIGYVVEDIRPIHHIQPEEYRNMIKLLLAKGTNVNIQGDYQEWTALHGAARNGDMAMVNLLITHDADFNARDGFGNTPLHYFVESGHRNIVQKLLSQGADANAKNERGLTPMDLASQHGDIETYRILETYGAQGKIKYKSGQE